VLTSFYLTHISQNLILQASPIQQHTVIRPHFSPFFLPTYRAYCRCVNFPNHPFLTQKERDVETGLDYFLARYYSSAQGRFTSPDPIIISDKQTHNPQLWNLYNYSGNNPLAYLDPTGMERVKLGRHDDAYIDNRRKEIDRQLKKDKSLTKAGRETLKREKRTLELEKEGNQIARKFLAKLDSIGERQGLQVSDFTLSTGGPNDFLSDPTFVAAAGSSERAKTIAEKTAAGSMFVFPGNWSSEIFINTSGMSYQGALGNNPSFETADFIIFMGTQAVHERSHRDSPTEAQRLSEGTAYKEQLRVLQRFGPNAFKSRDYYNIVVDHVTAGTKQP
jgi:RHS repeat-associated protein